MTAPLPLISSRELISSISVSQHLLEVDVCILHLGPGTLPPGTDGSHTFRRRISITKAKATDPNTTARLTTSLKELEDGRVSSYDLEIAKHRGNLHAHITPDGVAMRRCRSLACPYRGNIRCWRWRREYAPLPRQYHERPYRKKDGGCIQQARALGKPHQRRKPTPSGACRRILLG